MHDPLAAFPLLFQRHCSASAEQIAGASEKKYRLSSDYGKFIVTFYFVFLQIHYHYFF